MAKQRNHAIGDKDVAKVATSQKGVVSVGQLAAAGVSRRAAALRANRSRLHRLHRGVYAVGHAAIDERGRHLAAALACGPGAAISHLSAAALWGIREPAPVVIDVVVPCQTGRKIDGIRARRCRYPLVDEVTDLEGVPCTTPSRTLVDLGGILGRTGLTRAMEQAAVLGFLDLSALDAAIARARGRPGIRTFRAILTSWRNTDGDPPRLRSALEAWLLRAIVEAGLPHPRCNAKLEIDGERFEVDLLWERERVVVETDGEATHGTPVAFQRDQRRSQFFAAGGYRAARVTWRHMQEEPSHVLDRIRQMLGRGPIEP